MMTTRGANYRRIEADDYPTPGYVTRALLDMIGYELADRLCDPAPGEGAMLKEFRRCGKHAFGKEMDFINDPFPGSWHGSDIFTNPPYGDRRGTLARQFVERALEITKPWRGKVVMLLPLDFDAGITRRHLFEHKAFAAKIMLPNSRIKWFEGTSGSPAHAWYLWNWKNTRRPVIRYMPISSNAKEN